MILALLAAATVFVGSTFDGTIRGTNLDPIVLSTNPVARQAFSRTLNGPQEPAIEVVIDGRELLVWETCMAHLCSSNHSVIVIDRKNAREYAATYTDEGVYVLVNASFGPVIDRYCRKNSCGLKPQKQGRSSFGEALLQRDLSGVYGGANCMALNAKGETVLYTEGAGFIRHNGKLRRLVEDGIGGPYLYTDDEGDPLLITIVERPGTPSRRSYELSERSITILVRDRTETISIAAIMRCES